MRVLRFLALSLPLFAFACGSDDTSSGGPSPEGQDASAETSLPEGGGGGSDAEAPDVVGPDSGVDADDGGTEPDAEIDAQQPEGGEPDGDTPDQALTQYAEALCGLFDTCAPYMLGYLYGDLQTCVDRYVAGGGTAVLPQGPGVGRTPADVIACANAMSTMSCSELYAGARDTACPPIPGTLAEGGDCFSNLQCESGFCKRLGDCGTCAPRIASGGACEFANNGCDDGLVCHSPTIADPTTCTPTAQQGEACSPTVVCAGNLHCSSGTCEQPGGEGDSCDGSEGSCNGLLGLRCSGGTCKKTMTLAPAGQPCGIQGSSYVPCVGTAYCDATSKVCVAKSGDGEPCEPGSTNTCLYFASCQNDVCTVDSEPTCP